MSYALTGLGQAATEASLAEETGVPLPAIQAIRQIESGGNPRAVRFETRVFRNRTGRTVEGSDRAAFQRAYLINPLEAVNSTSWGWFQVMGFHGFPEMYGGPAEAVRAFDADPQGVGVRLFKRWMSTDRAEAAKAAARRLDFATFASIYNGCSLVPGANHPCSTYQTRMRAAYERALRGELTVRRVAGEAIETIVEHPVAAGTGLALGVAVLSAGAAFAWWAYSKSTKRVKRNRRRSSLTRKSRSSRRVLQNIFPKWGTEPSSWTLDLAQKKPERAVARTTRRGVQAPILEEFVRKVRLEFGHEWWSIKDAVERLGMTQSDVLNRTGHWISTPKRSDLERKKVDGAPMAQGGRSEHWVYRLKF